MSAFANFMAEFKALLSKHHMGPAAAVSGGGHLVFVPPAEFVLPIPANYAYDVPDPQYGSVHSWAHDEIIAEVQQFGQIDPHHKQYADFFISTLKARDQVVDNATACPVTDEAAKALNLATAYVQFINVVGWKDGMDASGQVIVNPSPTIACWSQQYTLATLIYGFRAAFQYNLDKGADVDALAVSKNKKP